jgi:membrane protease YdiL (CAAX protease family)
VVTGSRRRPLLAERTVLDEQMAYSRRMDPRPWGPAPWLGPVVVLILTIVVSQLLAALAPAGGGGRTVFAIVVTLGAEAVALAGLYLFGQPVARRAGGWRVAIGIDWVRRRDWLPWLIGVALSLAGRIGVGVLFLVLTDGRANREAQNIHVSAPTAAQIAFLLGLAVMIAPIIEEIMFRGLLLRTFMRRMSFWPAAVLSTSVFAVFHTYEVSTVGGALALAASVATLGMTNCYLVRITGRLAPGMLVHASFNLVATVFVILQAS